MQQHSGQHVLSAALVRLFDMPTVSFHMGDGVLLDRSGHDKRSRATQVEEAEQLANELCLRTGRSRIKFVTQEEAQSLGLRKPPRAEKDEAASNRYPGFRSVRLRGDARSRHRARLAASCCEKSKKFDRDGGWSSCAASEQSQRRGAITHTLTEAAALFSAHIWDVPQQVRKSLEEVKCRPQNVEKRLLEEMAECKRPVCWRRRFREWRESWSRSFSGPRPAFIRLLGTEVDAAWNECRRVAGGNIGTALAWCSQQSKGQPFDMGALLKETLGETGWTRRRQ